MADNTRIPKSVTWKAPRAEKAVAVNSSVADTPAHTPAVNLSSVKTCHAASLGNPDSRRDEGDHSDGSSYRQFASQGASLFGLRQPISHRTDANVCTWSAVSRFIA
jgi:hypothetical protein